LLAGSDGWKNEEIHQLIGQSKEISYLGFVSAKQLKQLYQKAFCKVYSSWYEGFGLPVLEAMENACPVISSDVSSLPEVGGDAVLYFAPNKPEQLSDQLLKLSNDPQLREQLKERGINQAASFSWQKTAEKTIQIITGEF